MILARQWRYAVDMTTALTNGDAIAIASAWINNSDLPFVSAFIGGSIAHTDRDSRYDPASDVDCYLVVDGDPPVGKIGKITVDGVLLDVSWIPWSALEHAESDAVMASLLNFGLVVQDDGRLASTQGRIQRGFNTPEAIAARLESMRTKIRNGLSGDSSHLVLPEQVMNWLFPATLATHIPLISACRPLTVRKRFLAARAVMAPADYESLLALYGFDTVTESQAQAWLDATARLFDATTDIAAESDRFWASDIQADARHIAIDGSQRLIDSGVHREALYWIIATSSRCLSVMNDAEADTSAFEKPFAALVESLGIANADQRAMRTAKILEWIKNETPPH